MSSRSCKYDKDSFCYICGTYMTRNSRRHQLASSDKLISAYEQYFGLKLLQDKDKCWAPQYACNSCSSSLLNWLNGQRKGLPFGIPRVWREPSDHLSDCYFCVTVVATGKKKSIYPDIPSSRAPVPHSESLPVPSAHENPVFNNESDLESEDSVESCESTCVLGINKVKQQKFDEYVRRMSLNKSQSEELRKIFREIGILHPSVTFRYTRNRHDQYSSLFEETDGYCFCKDVPTLIKLITGSYDPDDFLLFLDGSVSGLKVALLKTNGVIPPIPLCLWNNCAESYATVQKVFNDLKYSEHQWKICADFKMLQILMGLRSGGNIRHPCIFCEFHAQSKERFDKIDWKYRDTFTVGAFSVQNPPLAQSNQIVLPVLHIKLGIFKQYIKYLNNEAALQSLISIFPRTTATKLHSGILTGPQVDKIAELPEFVNTLSTDENMCRLAILAVFRKVLVPHSTDVLEKRKLVDKMIALFKKLNINYSPKLHYIDIHLPELLERQFQVSDQHGERLHQTFKSFDSRYAGKSLTNKILDYIWMKVSCASTV